MPGERVYLYDTTLRDGAQTHGVDFSAADKAAIADALDSIGIDYIEGGWPGANPRDDAFFQQEHNLTTSTLTAFGMTRRSGRSAANDPSLTAVLSANTPAVCLVGKTHDAHALTALGVDLEENLRMISESVSECVGRGRETIFDAEHFFDGYKANPDYSMEVINTAYQAGAKWIILCDTNGGTLPHEITNIISQIVEKIPGSNLGIHCHNDTGNAVANSIAAVMAGARQIQGTLNGLGERCGNTNLITIIPTLKLKLGYDISISDSSLKKLKTISNYLCDMLNYPYDPYSPYVGAAAFTHKGGLHASGMSKNTKSYEHINPNLVGNSRNILVSNQSGKAAIISRLKEFNFDFNEDKIGSLIELIKEKETAGFSYDSANASFALLAYEYFHQLPKFFELESYKVINERRTNAAGKLVNSSEAIVKLIVHNKRIIQVAEGNGPVAALDNAFHKLLVNYYPILNKVRLSDYKVRILDSEAATSAVIRVLIETIDDIGNRWVSIGVGTDLIDASYMALSDAINYILLFKASGSVN